MDLDIPPFEHTYDEHKVFVQDIAHTMSNRLTEKWFLQFPFYAAIELPYLVERMTEIINKSAGDLSTTQWTCSDKHLEYGYYEIIAEYRRYI